LLKIEDCKLVALFSPEHGIFGEAQDMIEIDDSRHPPTKLPIYSLYGRRFEPPPEVLHSLTTLIFDIQDIGTRVYTYISTMAHAMRACKKHGLEMFVLDRPNPINGVYVEGNVLSPSFSSFVGFYPIPMRHGMTTGELARLFNEEFNIKCNLTVIPMDGWRRNLWYDECGFPFIPPSPNMPHLSTAIVYPGCVLIEGTNLSEGRGTTRPFEFVGAPFIDPYKLVEELEKENLPGVKFRPTYFKPMFQKWKEELCGGVQIHVTNRDVFKPYLTGIHIIKVIYEIYKNKFKWRSPPYEYEKEKLPFDILAGGDSVRRGIEEGVALQEIEGNWMEELNLFLKLREKYLLYGG
jgi:uncharacterized protein YbbC (DUF1343 family)